jgi:hypothetical protein
MSLEAPLPPGTPPVSPVQLSALASAPASRLAVPLTPGLDTRRRRIRRQPRYSALCREGRGSVADDKGGEEITGKGIETEASSRVDSGFRGHNRR